MKLGILGHHIAYTISPVLHELICKEANLSPVEYSRFDIPPQELYTTLKKLQTEGYTGVNVTTPYKKSVFPYVTSLSDEVKKCGSANTLCFTKEEIQASNTDLSGLIRVLTNFPLASYQQFVLFGYGGVAPAVVYALKALGVQKIAVTGRSLEKIQEFCQQFNVSRYHPQKDSLVSPTLWINATPVGSVTYPEIPHAFKINPTKSDSFLDLNYAPLPTYFQRYFQTYGIETHDGLGLLIEQAIDSQRIWRKDANFGKGINRMKIHNKLIEKLEER
ncbi:MAG: hypothetical protein PHE86_06260 [Candidatus Marinimicrobia bacterium]|jgi:shikimate dehydrogenase|nr:hypothetical protein [Candidatus Neomarinimicrobiota bacterium]MDD5582081.1 hypothetical protein [Candidatus Neomarinimicrobiota bacterium]